LNRITEQMSINPNGLLGGTLCTDTDTTSTKMIFYISWKKSAHECHVKWKEKV